MTRPVLTIVSLIVLTVVMTACGGETADTTAGPSEAAEPSGGRLAQVQERDSLICGVNDGLPGFGFLDENGENVGFDVDFCRAIAAAVLGDPTKVEFRALDADGRQPAIQSGEIDVLLRNTTWTVSRDSTWGLFAPTTFYDGQGIMVRSADGIASLEDLAGATICVQTGTTTELNLADVFGARGIEFTPQPFGDDTQTYDAYDEGSCDAVTIARPLIANPDLVKTFAAGRDAPERPCTYCNKCLVNVIENPLGCYELSRYDGDNERMMREVMSVFEPTGFE